MLDEKLLQERLEQFNPEPLIDYDAATINPHIETPIIIEDANNIDLAKANYLNVLNNEAIKKASEDIIREYGVGTCGPRAFYGTTDVHLELEECIAKFLGVDDSIVYSYGVAAISSSIAAYCKRNDVIFADEMANIPINLGLEATRSKIVKFKHQNADDFALQVEKFVEKEIETNKNARKFVIVEAISWRTGKLCPLLDFLKVAEKYKIRIFLEETYTFGVLGKTGKGFTEHLNIEPDCVDMIFGTLEGAIGGYGGFCAGSEMIIEHQRLSGSGYVFSASLPTYLVKSAIKSIELLENKPQQLVAFAIKMDEYLKQCDYDVISDPKCPFKLFTIKNVEETERREKEREIHEYCKNNGVHFLFTDNGLMLNLNIALIDDPNRLEKLETVLKAASNL